MSNSTVIAISGVSGAGKTTIVKQLAKFFNSPYLLFDDFVDQRTYPKDIKSWFQKGADVSLILTPEFESALTKLISLYNSRFIFIEEPFGRERNSILPLIDYVILLDQPMELCLARIIKRHIEYSRADPTGTITTYLKKYQDHLRDVYITTANQIRSNADLIIQDVVSAQKTTDYICNWLNNQKK